MKLLAEASTAAISGKTILVRADFDVPLKDGRVTDPARIELVLPTVRYLIGHQAKVILLAHLDRPGGKVVARLRLDPVAVELSRELTAVHKLDDCVGPQVESAVAAAGEGDILLLENLRFHSGEEANDPKFAKALAKLGNLYVNDAFATCHRSHASIVGIPKLLPSYAGFRLVEEVETLKKIVERPVRPLVVIIGGAKVETKAAVVRNMARIADRVLLGGKVSFVKELENLPRVVFPGDSVDGKDIGPRTIERYRQIISQARTIVWAGPPGVFEEPRFAEGTRAVAAAVAASSAFTVVGGGETIAALGKFGYHGKIDFVSAGGGALLEFLSGKKLPGLEALSIE